MEEEQAQFDFVMDFFRGSAYAVLLCRLLLPASVLFGTFGVVLEEQAERSEAKQKGLEKPHAASGHVVDTFVAAHLHCN